MAKESRQVNSSLVSPAGMNDNQVLSQDPNFFFLHGVHSHSQQFLQRMSGKRLIDFLDSPILAIHGELKDIIWVETETTLYMVQGSLKYGIISGGGGDDVMEDYALVVDQKARGVTGGNFNGGVGAYVQRELNTILSDEENFIDSLIGDEIGLPAGTYRFAVSAPAYGVNKHKIVVDINDGGIHDYRSGTAEFSNATNPSTSRSVAFGTFTIANTQTFRVFHACQTTNADGRGFPADQPAIGSTDDVEIYTIVEFWKLRE